MDTENKDFLGRGIAYPFAFVGQTGSLLVSTSVSANRDHIRQSIEQILVAGGFTPETPITDP